jgi:hypothetical protein
MILAGQDVLAKVVILGTRSRRTAGFGEFKWRTS